MDESFDMTLAEGRAMRDFETKERTVFYWHRRRLSTAAIARKVHESEREVRRILARVEARLDRPSRPGDVTAELAEAPGMRFLKPVEQTILKLHRKRMTDAEIARQINHSEQAVRVLLARINAKLDFFLSALSESEEIADGYWWILAG
jgi:DNA-binding CsgD family transcriptional regulator